MCRKEPKIGNASSKGIRLSKARGFRFIIGGFILAFVQSLATVFGGGGILYLLFLGVVSCIIGLIIYITHYTLKDHEKRALVFCFVMLFITLIICILEYGLLTSLESLLNTLGSKEDVSSDDIMVYSDILDQLFISIILLSIAPAMMILAFTPFELGMMKNRGIMLIPITLSFIGIIVSIALTNNSISELRYIIITFSSHYSSGKHVPTPDELVLGSRIAGFLNLTSIVAMFWIIHRTRIPTEKAK